jgi:hypothetical protein
MIEQGLLSIVIFQILKKLIFMVAQQEKMTAAAIIVEIDLSLKHLLAIHAAQKSVLHHKE